MTEAAMLKIIVASQGGLFLLITFCLWQQLDTLRQDHLRLKKQVGKTAVPL